MTEFNWTTTFAKTSKKKVNGKVNGNGKGNGKGNGNIPGASNTTEVNKKSEKYSNWSKAFATLAENTPGSVHRSVDYNKNVSIREGVTTDELAQGDEIGNYDAWLRRQNKNKKNNSNYA
tara:strand:- start:155 stop:511 length:357 start_codon:yes stop_codon:yes gene_type:complete